MYEDDLAAIQDIEEHPTADEAVKHDVPLGLTSKSLYTPSTSDDADGKYAAAVANLDPVEPEEIVAW